MAENEKPLSDYISSVEQVDVPVDVVEGEKEVVVKPKKSKVFPILVGILLLFIIGMGGYYVYKEYIKGGPNDFLKSPDDVPTPDLEPVDSSVIDPSQLDTLGEYVTQNNGTRTFTLPQYEFSAEMPIFTMKKTEGLEGEDGKYYETINWAWNAEELQLDDPSINLYPDYLKSISMTFLPGGEAPGCGLGCVHLHDIEINIFQNKGEKSLDSVKKVYFANIKALEDEENKINITESKAFKWNNEIIKFSGIGSGPDSLNDGYLVVTPKFVYIVSYYLGDEQVDSLQVANDLIDSFKFGE